MQQTEQFIQAISQYFDQSVATASDDELFAAGYLRGHVDLGVGRLQVAEQPFVAADIISLVDESLASAIAGGELSEADEQLVRQIWQQVQALSA
ncbi:MAG TPA: hypothetical protein DF774_03135 [Rheinheimera sp.]|uniref:YfcL family protein n=1 Tax=Rheinheimera sp. TaxID=1869214 RepID=UPI000EDC4D16|nr:YfcL family protein [Rheinheimera sp.]HCU64735.1 hypothetical protein [Rheinheimera sp.]